MALRVEARCPGGPLPRLDPDHLSPLFPPGPLQGAAELVLDIREHDVPHHMRFAIDADVRCGRWYNVCPQARQKGVGGGGWFSRVQQVDAGCAGCAGGGEGGGRKKEPSAVEEKKRVLCCGKKREPFAVKERRPPGQARPNLKRTSNNPLLPGFDRPNPLGPNIPFIPKTTQSTAGGAARQALPGPGAGAGATGRGPHLRL